MERSAIREIFSRTVTPDFAALHPGYEMDNSFAPWPPIS